MVGPKMQAALEFIARHPGCPKMWPADYVAPHGKGRQYGYQTVDRLLRAGLVRAEQGKGNRYALYVVGIV